MKTKTVPVQLEKERHLLYDVNALIALGDELGINLLTKEGWEDLIGKKGEDGNFVAATPSLRRVRAIVWAGLLHEDPTLTVRQVGAMLNPTDLGPVVAAYTEAWSAQDVSESADPNAPAPASASAAG